MEDPLITYTRNKFADRAGKGHITEEAWFKLLAERDRLKEIVQEFLINHECSCIIERRYPCPRCKVTIDLARELVSER